jgi:hypothetical protein
MLLIIHSLSAYNCACRDQCTKVILDGYSITAGGLTRQLSSLTMHDRNNQQRNDAVLVQN